MPDHLTNPLKTPLLAGTADDRSGCELQELALDLRSTWIHATDEVWRQLDPALWELTQNPWVVLQTVSKDKLKSVSADPAFRKKVEEHIKWVPAVKFDENFTDLGASEGGFNEDHELFDVRSPI